QVIMTVWLRRSGTGAFTQQPIDVETNPSPVIMAGGLGGGNLSQYWLEDDGKMLTDEQRERIAARFGKALPTRKAKPPYRVPLMSEIRALPWNGFTVASTFAGGGGSSLGYRMAGFRIGYANEFVEAARDTYRANAWEGTTLDGSDIRTVEAPAILAALGMKPGDLDIFDGSPPCSSFSTAGKREKGWGEVKKYSDTEQRTDDLFLEYIRLVDGLRPKVFVAENVKGLVLGTAFGFYRQVHERLTALGYRVEARVLNAKWLGVPQSRERTIFVGVRDDLGFAPVFPEPLPYIYSIADAIPWLRNGSSQGGVDITGYAIGNEWDRLKPGEQSDKYFQLVRPDPNLPVGTITAEGGNASIASVTHPFERRKFSIPEVKRLCSFPDDWAVSGSYTQQWERMGRAVPPVMMMAIASAIRDQILIPHREATCSRSSKSPSNGRSKRTR
ncbi:MAG TPA: DNA cytosine methyltransferase, partial [Polyangiaceae bacterium]|nr:DNA cytosine methyltransferase [Polyangiaceae bacterium]